MYYCQLKSYGDFVIQLNFLNRIGSTEKLLCGDHLKPLAEAIGVDKNINWISLKDKNKVPAIYDIQERGWYAAISSIFDINKNFKYLCSTNDLLVFPHVGFREKLMGNPFSLQGILPQQTTFNNI
jgi:hypothetical protein